ncbi:alpha/beta fold hydrolase [Sphingomonas sp.]|uniref:alpha/beta fold hydrolase n=1 Tax=Sphingomonas sp. TaxID=28214 RepID=UPI003CC6AECB
MITQHTARLIAFVAAPLALANVTHAHAQPAPAAPAAAQAAATVLPHISITTMGRGSPVVLIPGLSSPREVWAGVAPQIARNHRVILVQVNGFGGDAPGANLQPGLLDGVVTDLNGYLASQHLGPVDVIGHSMGGLLALMMAKAHPQAVHRLMVVDSLPWIGTLFGPTLTVAQVEPQARAMRDQMAAVYGSATNPSADATAARLALKPESRAQVAAWVNHADARVTAQAFYADMTTDLRPAMAAIATPITLVYPGTGGADDQGAALYRAAYAQAPHVTYVPVADSAHFIMLDQPAAFAAAVQSFLN